MEQFIIKNNSNKVQVDLHEDLYLNILRIVYLRDKGLYKILKSKYEQLTQKNFNDKLLNKNNM